MFIPEGTARLIKAGSKINFQIHYSRATGKPETDITSVGLTFAKEPPKQIARRIDFRITCSGFRPAIRIRR